MNDFVVAFSDFSIVHYGNPPNIKAYITPYGVYGSSVNPPYVKVDNNRIAILISNYLKMF